MFKALKIILSVFIALIVTVFAVKNSRVVAIDLWPLPLQFKLTLSLVLIGTFTVGALAGGLLVWISQISKRFLKPAEKESRHTLPQDLN
ncbi:MAG: LapA family protein [Alphaproteobacteria bacterium]|nr:LapA family protein [Alphaproteobacteria bacterium]NCQ66522.1 LapA family protein [Alphaproteobacteria bacterium]NCT08313.1 LapA family protein [Alphaproteobacteria bacterium]